MNINQFQNVSFGSAGDIEESTGFEPMPAGDYIVKLTDADVKETKNRDGQFVEAVFTVADENGQFAGRKIYHNFNFQNKSPKAQQIGLGELKALCRCARGELQPHEQFSMQHVIESLNRPILVKVSAKSNTYNGQTTIRNEISSFKDGYNALAATSPAQQPAQQPVQQQMQQQMQQPAQQSAPQGGWQQPAQQVAPQGGQQPAWNK